MGLMRRIGRRATGLLGRFGPARRRTTQSEPGTPGHDHGAQSRFAEKPSIQLSSEQVHDLVAPPKAPAADIDIPSVLVASDVFAGFGPAVYQALSREAEIIDLQEGASLFRAGDPENAVYIVCDGRLAVTGERAGRDMVLGEPEAGSAVGAYPAIGTGRRAVSVDAQKASRVLKVSAHAIADLSRRFPGEVARIAGRMADQTRRTRVGMVLRASPVFRELDDSVLRDVEAEMEVARAPAGSLIGRAGEPMEALFMVVNGRLRTWTEQPRRSSALLREAGQGECVDEIAIVGGADREADIRAVRDTTVAKLNRHGFERLLHRHPQGINHLTTEVVAKHYKKMCVRQTRPLNNSTGFALIPAHPGAPVAEVARMMARSMGGKSGAAVIDAPGLDAQAGIPGFAETSFGEPRNQYLVEWLERQEFDAGRVLMVADETATNWTKRCLRHADQALLIADARAVPDVGALEAELMEADEALGLRKSLVLVHPPGTDWPRGTKAWLEGRTIGSHHHVRLGNAADFGRLARVITGNAVALVLGGGGARGFAHVGVLKAMEELGIPIDMIGGTSVGSLIGAQYAVGRDPATIYRQTLDLCLSGEELTIPLVSLFAGGKMTRGIAEMFGPVAFEDLWVPFFAVSCNLSRARVNVHDHGALTDGVLASNTPPGLFPPRVDGGDLLVDGCLLNNIPADVMERYADGGSIIAIDVSPREDLLANTAYEEGLSGWKVLESRLNPLAEPINVPSIKDTISRATAIGGLAKQKLVKDGYADLYISPPVSEFQVMAYKDAGNIAEVGYNHARPLLEEWWTRGRTENDGVNGGCRTEAEATAEDAAPEDFPPQSISAAE